MSRVRLKAAALCACAGFLAPGSPAPLFPLGDGGTAPMKRRPDREYLLYAEAALLLALILVGLGWSLAGLVRG